MNNNLIIYHKVDLDGVASAAIVANKVIEYEGHYDLYGWTYGDESLKNLDVSKYQWIWILDLSFGKEHIEIIKKWKEQEVHVIWIDHHKSAIIPEPEIIIGGLRKIGKGACELTWEFLYNSEAPWIIQYLSAYDVWDKERFDWDDVMAIQYAMRERVGLNVHITMDVISSFDQHIDSLGPLIYDGKRILSFLKQKNENECKNSSFEATVEGYRAICMNTLEFNSTTFDSIWDENKYDLMVPFAIQPNGLVRFSLYTTKEDIDCSEIAKKFEGGGHKGAAGFQLHVEYPAVINFFSKKNLSSTPDAYFYQKAMGLLSCEMESFNKFLLDPEQKIFEPRKRLIFKSDNGDIGIGTGVLHDNNLSSSTKTFIS